MQRLLLAISLILPVIVSAQYTSQEIKKNKISKITGVFSSGDGSETAKQEHWYDREGQDTAVYNDGKLYKRTQYEYNDKGKPVKRISYKADGGEMESAWYDYRPDGSYTIVNTDKQFGLTDHTYCDKLGRIIKTVPPDGQERIYTYNAKGQLEKIKSKSLKGSIVVDLQYSYNSKGQCIKEVSKGEFKWTKTFIYNANGLLIGSINHEQSEGASTQTTESYSYEFWK